METNKHEVLSDVAKRMEQEDIVVHGGSQTHKDKYCVFSLTKENSTWTQIGDYEKLGSGRGVGSSEERDLASNQSQREGMISWC